MDATTTEHIRTDLIPDIYVPRKVAEDLMSTGVDRVEQLARQGKLRVRRAVGGHRRYSLRDALALVVTS